MTADLTRAEVERDEYGWPVRMSEGLRLCARPGVSHYSNVEEFRIDGYCSCECRDMDEVEKDLATMCELMQSEQRKAYMRAYRAQPETKNRERERQRECRKDPAFRARAAEAAKKCRSRPEWKEWKTNYDRERRHGMSPEAFCALAESQGRKCLICKRERQLHVDHCHETNRIRGLLCNQCNVGLGSFRDSPSLLRAAAGYLGDDMHELEEALSARDRRIEELSGLLANAASILDEPPGQLDYTRRCEALADSIRATLVRAALAAEGKP